MDQLQYFYQKTYRRKDGHVYVKRYSRSFPLGQKIDQPSEDRGSNVKEASLSRARSQVRLLSFSNPDLAYLLTLTFADNITDEDEASAYFKKYREEVRSLYPDWKYLGVKEFQKRGAIHYHLLVNFCPQQVHRPLSNRPHQQQSALWNYGISDFRRIVGDEKFSTELYLLKYLTKADQKLFRQYYVRSRNLDKIEPTYFNTREPIHPLATNVYMKKIELSPVSFFNVMEYNYKYKVKTLKGVKSELGKL